MAGKINDTFGERIGMSRRDIWKLLHGGKIREALAGLEKASKGEKELFYSMATRDALWPKPSYEFNGEGLAMPFVSKEIFLDLVRLSLPPKCPDSFYVNLVMKTREIAESLPVSDDGKIDAGKLSDFLLEQSYDAWRKFRKNMLSHARFLENAIVAGFPKFRHQGVFHSLTRIEYKNNREQTGVSGRYMGKHVDFDDVSDFQAWASGLKKKKGESKLETPVRPMLEHITRKGFKESVESISPERFQARFGFRGGEFGNWLSQEDRRQSLVWAADSFSDLAKLLNIDDSAIGGDSLAFAFGARGNGGKAVAHYEPLLNVINLTKMGGAGSAAHEWAHYVDFQILKPRGLGSQTMKWLFERPIENDFELLQEQRKRELANAEVKLVTWLPTRKEGEAMFALFPEMDREKYRKACFGIVERHIVPKSRAKAEQWMRFLKRRLEIPYQTTDSKFMENARVLDNGRSKPYWSTPAEMWARAFEKFVQMKLADQNMHNDYLVTLYQSGTDPYPSDEEMQKMAPEIENVLAQVFSPRKEFKMKSDLDDIEFTPPPSGLAVQLSLF